MIKIDFFTPPNTDQIWQRWLTHCDTAGKKLVALVKNGNPPVINNKLYRRKSIKDKIYFSRNGPFKGKCVYCECYITDFQHGDMDHFRPKLGVTDENDQPVMIKDKKGNTIPHPGYYWLAYSYENLLPSCIRCNQAGTIDGKKIGKHNRFPVKDAHATTPAGVSKEEPLLINPLIEDPEKHLIIDTATGLLGFLSEKGKMCIEVFGLNLREQLVDQRRSICDQVRAKLGDLRDKGIRTKKDDFK